MGEVGPNLVKRLQLGQSAKQSTFCCTIQQRRRAATACTMAVPGRQLYIGGAWEKPSKGKTFDIYSPSSGSKIGTIPAATAEDVDKAVGSALKAFKSGVWSKQSGAHRAKYLRAIADKVYARSKFRAEIPARCQCLCVAECNVHKLLP